MCRNIKPLFNFDPPATEEEIRKASEQFVRKVSGFTKPSKVNVDVINLAIEKISIHVQDLMNNLVTNAPHKNREEEALKRKELFNKRNEQKI